ncbi:MAG: aminotransferase class V-fold PLP-dependent enzyme [Gemmatimonadetes bacterium]|nr:aminotransferase class V-fold PLP-dependent enzyme [Gemmatimonadota bacterium]
MQRRDFLRAAPAAALAWPAQLSAFRTQLRRSTTPPTEDYWEVVRSAFLVPDDRIYLNVGTLGVQPRVVVDAVVEHTRRVAMSYPPGVEWDTLKQEAGTLLNGDPAGFVFPRNTTEGMNFVAQGLELDAGDEVLTTDHEHIGGLCCWQLLAARRGVVLRPLPIPPTPRDAGESVDRFRRARSARTRVLSVSHVNFTNGVVMPVRALVELARPRGVLVVVDGAHPPGMMPVDLRALDADCYASSPHKWLLAPQGSGLLYLREEWRARLWPTLASGGWDDPKLGADRLNHLGTADESRLAGLLAALRFHQAIGSERVHARIRELRGMLREAVAGIPGVAVITPPGDELSAGLLSLRTSRPALDVQAQLARAANIRTRVIGEYGYGWLRLSAHVYNRPAEITRMADVLRAVLQGRV